jgi:hypothetical protein
MHHYRFWFLVAASIVLAVSILALEAAAIPQDPPQSGDWIIVDQVEFEDKTGYVERNIIVSPAATFQIKNSVLTINHSLIVNGNANIKIINSTILFNCSMSVVNRFEILALANCEIQDLDGDRTTTGDMSIITSTNDIPYNFTVFKNSTFTLRNSQVSKCGRPFVDPYLDEGLVIGTNDAVISGAVITDGHYGLVLDQCERVRVDNTTIEDCYNGLYMRGTRECSVSESTMVNNTVYGAEIRGFHGNLVLENLVMSGNGVANMVMVYISGFNNEVINCTFGPVGSYGIRLEEVEDTALTTVTVTGCDVGFEVRGGNVEITDMTVSDCTQGVISIELATVRFVELSLRDTTIEVDRTTDTNITAMFDMTWERVTANLTCDLAVQIATTMTFESCTLNFADSRDGPTGLYCLRGGTLKVANSTVDSPSSHSLMVQLLDGSRATFFMSTFSHLGTTIGGSSKFGMFVAGTGTIEEVTLADSLVGLVVGKSLANIINLTIHDCLTGILADGDLGRGGVSIRGLDLQDCNVAVRAVNDGSVSVVDGRFQLSGEGFNITMAGVELKDSWVSVPGAGMSTARLRQTSTLDIINSVTSRDFDIGPVENAVNIYWYLNLTMLYLSDGSPLSEALVTVKEASGATSNRDVEAGVDGTIQELRLRERTYLPDLTITTPHTITVTMDGLEDSFSLTVEASMDHVFYMDNYPPVLVVSSPEDGSLYNVSTVTVEGEAWDAVITTTEGLATMRYRVDDGNWTPIDLPVLTEWSFDAVLEDGFHVLEIQVFDRIGNMNWTTRTVEIDTMPPGLAILSPDDGLHINYTDVTVEGVTDMGSTVMVNGISVPVDGEGKFNRTLTLSDGVNVIVIVAIDVQGNSATETRTVTVDTVIPQVHLDQDDFITNELTFTLSGTKKADSTLYVNGFLPQFFGATTWDIQVDLLVEGLNAVDIWSEDLAGNNWSTTILIERDTTAPDLTVGQLPEFTNKPTITVQGSTDDAEAIVTVNGEVVTLSGLTFARTIQLTEGSNTITVEAADPLGNSADDVVQTVILSTVPPPVTIVTPKMIETLEDSYLLEGETDPGLPVSVHVILGAYSKTYSLTAGEGGTFTLTVALPQIGNHSVTVTVTNEAGNQASEEVFFVRNRQDPSKPPVDEGPPWLEDNWAYVILIAAVIASAGIWIMTISAGKRRREELVRDRAARAAKAAEEAEEEGWEEEPEDEDDEDAPDEEVEGEGAVEEENEEEWVDEDEVDEAPADDEPDDEDREEETGSEDAAYKM